MMRRWKCSLAPSGREGFRLVVALPRPPSMGSMMYHGFHTNDWFRAMFANVEYFQERRRKNPIDVAHGQLAEPTDAFTLYSKVAARHSPHDQRRHHQPLSSGGDAAARQFPRTAKQGAPKTIPALFKELGTDTMIRRVTASTWQSSLT